MSGLFKQRVKNNVKRTIDDLMSIEYNYFSKIEDVDEFQLGDKLVANYMEFISMLLSKFKFNDFSKMQEVAMAYGLDPDAVTKVSDKILLKNGAKV